METKQSLQGKLRFDPVNFLRVLAAMLVFLLHTSLFMNDPQELNDHGPWTMLVRPSAWAGVWIFFFLSGYLAEKGFFSGRYPLTACGVGRFYLQRIKKVWFPGLCFIFVCCILIYPTFISENPGVLIKFLTCTYTGVPGVNGIGATWFIFTLMWLYLIAPLAALMIRALKGKPWLLFCVTVLLALLGCGYRFFANYRGWDWSQRVYAAPYGNIDLFVCGMCISALRTMDEKRAKKAGWIPAVASTLFLAGCVLLGGYCNYTTDPLFTNLLHTCLVPSLMLLSAGLFLWCFDRLHTPMPGAERTHPLGLVYRLINWLSALAFPFYLFHSVVLYAISANIVSGGGAGEYFTLLTITAAFTTVFAYGWNRIFIKQKITK